MKNITSINNINRSTILIVNSIEDTLFHLTSIVPKHSLRVIKNEDKGDFLLAQANMAIKEAYITSNSKKYIALCGTIFKHEAQNSLLKVLEEPPKNIIFIIITTTKATILPTIFSRIGHKYLKQNEKLHSIDLNIKHLNLKEIYLFLKQNERVSKEEAKNIVQSILLKVNEQKVKLAQKQLDIFFNSMRLLNLNSKPINVLTMLLLTLVNKKRYQDGKM